MKKEGGKKRIKEYQESERVLNGFNNHLNSQSFKTDSVLLNFIFFLKKNVLFQSVMVSTGIELNFLKLRRVTAGMPDTDWPMEYSISCELRLSI